MPIKKKGRMMSKKMALLENHRRDTRQSVSDISVHWRHTPHQNWQKAFINDWSDSGMGLVVESSPRPRAGEDIELYHKNLPEALQCKVVRTIPLEDGGTFVAGKFEQIDQKRTWSKSIFRAPSRKTFRRCSLGRMSR